MVTFLVDRKSFPIHCAELDELRSMFENNTSDDYSWHEFSTESPTEFFNTALELAEDSDLVVPITRNLYIRDRLRQEGVNLIICL